MVSFNHHRSRATRRLAEERGWLTVVQPQRTHPEDGGCC